MKINFNLTQYTQTETEGFQPLPKGEHTFSITEMRDCVSQKSGIEMIKGIFKELKTGVTIHHYFLVNHPPEKGGDRSKMELAKVFMFTETPISEGVDTETLIGKQVNALVTIDGKGYNKIKTFRKSMIKPLASDDLPF